MQTEDFRLLLEQGLAAFLPAMLQDSPSNSSSQGAALTQNLDQTQVGGQGPSVPQPETTSHVVTDPGIDFTSCMQTDETAVEANK